MQILPGPEAHELCVHLGMVARGRVGGLLAGLGFMLPGMALMLLAGWLYVTWIAGDAGLSSLLLGVQIVVLAIILRAVVRIGEHIVEDWLSGAIAVASLIATLAGVPFWVPLVAAGLDRKSVVLGKNVSVRVDFGGRRLLKKKACLEIRFDSYNTMIVNLI